MTTRKKLRALKLEVQQFQPGTHGQAVLTALLELLDDAVFVDELPSELARQVRPGSAARAKPEKVWRRRYRCKTHGTITGPLCPDCASERKPPSALVEELGE
jgi:hypothetical protein